MAAAEGLRFRVAGGLVLPWVLLAGCGPDETPGAGLPDVGDDDSGAADDDAPTPDDDSGGPAPDDDSDVPAYEPGDPLTLEASVAPEAASLVEVVDVAISPPWIFATGQGGFWVLDASEPSAPVQVATLGGGDFGRGDRLALAADGWIAATAQPGGEDGALRLVDVRAPEAPLAVWSTLGPDLYADVAALPDGSFLVCARQAGLQTWLRDGEALVLAHSLLDLPDCSAVSVHGDRAAVGLGSDGLALVDASDPLAPAPLGQVALDGFVQRVAFDGERAWVAAGSAGIALVDARDPSAPFLSAVSDEGWTVFDVAPLGDVAFAAGMTDLFAVDFGDPAAPFLRAIERAPDIGLGVAVHDDLVVLADWNLVDVYRFHPDLGGPEFETTPRSAVYLEAGEDGAAEARLEVRNPGFAALEVVLSIDDPEVQVEPETLELAPSESATVTLRHEDASAEVDAVLRATTNDPDEGEATLSVLRGGDGLRVGDPAPDFTLARLLDAGTVTLSELAGSNPAVLLYFFTTW